MSKSEINENKKLLAELQNKINESNKKYYKDVLDFLNTLFDLEETSILKIKPKKIQFNENIIKIYNHIIKKHQIKKDFIDTKFFDFEIEYEQEDILKICLIMSNNLLEKLKYKLEICKYNNKKYFKIKTNP